MMAAVRSRTDTMMVLSWDKSAGKMRVISFMRDIYADIPGFKSYKLNTAYYLGSVQTDKRYDYRNVWYSDSSLRNCRLRQFRIDCRYRISQVVLKSMSKKKCLKKSV